MAAIKHCALERTAFTQLWKQLTPYVVVARPMTDLCWMCQRNNGHILKSGNLSEEEKSERLKQQEQHLQVVQAERTLYRDMVDASRTALTALEVEGLGSNPECSNIRGHYSFDYAQQVFYPFSLQQVGPLYLLVPRIVAIFGVNCEGLRRQVNYVTDEAVHVGKGANAVISQLHHFFANYGLGECGVDLHCDNCSGQNKNNFLMVGTSVGGLHEGFTVQSRLILWSLVTPNSLPIGALVC